MSYGCVHVCPGCRSSGDVEQGAAACAGAVFILTHCRTELSPAYMDLKGSLLGD